MRRLLLTIGLVVLAGGASALPANIAADALLQHVRFLASDDLKGRGNGTQGLDRAADYIAATFRNAGLEPGGRNGGWYQSFELVAGLKVGRRNQLTIDYGGQRISLALGAGYYPLGAPANENPAVASTDLEDLPVVFAGYGLVVPSLGYDDYAGIDVSGKAVLIFSHEPQERDPNSRLNGTRPMPQTSLQAKTAAAMNHGARVLIVVSDPSHPTDEANYRLFGLDPDAEDSAIPVLRARRTDMTPIIDAWSLDGVAREIDGDLKPRSRPLPGTTVDYVEHLAKNRQSVKNIVAVLRGSDPAKADEAVVIGAHYDHVGLGGRLSVTPERTGEIHNGADDNASGTAAILEMARAARQERSRFPRTLVFVAFAGEERGLLGSAFYVTQPAMPVRQTIAMLNLDMVGRSRGGVDISGLEVSPSMEADIRAAQDAAGVGLDVRREGPGAGRSDDSSFIAVSIPAINFFTGFHGDYHRPDDDWEKVDVEGTARIAQLALELAAQLAARPVRPEFIRK
jgi:hypothetical protein